MAKKNDDLTQEGEFVCAAGVEHWDSIIGLVESQIESYRNELRDLKKAARKKKQPVSAKREEAINTSIEQRQVTARILKANRRRLFGA